MENLELLIDLHKHATRQGPGGVEETRQAIELAMLDRTEELKIAEIGDVFLCLEKMFFVVTKQATSEEQTRSLLEEHRVL